MRQASASPTDVHPWRPRCQCVVPPAKVPNHLPGYDEVAGEVLSSLPRGEDPYTDGEYSLSRGLHAYSSMSPPL